MDAVARFPAAAAAARATDAAAKGRVVADAVEDLHGLQAGVRQLEQVLGHLVARPGLRGQLVGGVVPVRGVVPSTVFDARLPTWLYASVSEEIVAPPALARCVTEAVRLRAS